MIKNVLALFHYALYLALPGFFYLMFDGRLWPRTLPFVGIDDPLAGPVLVVFLTLLLALFVFMFRVVLDGDYREACFGGLAGLRERDEREAKIVGAAARQTFLLSLSVVASLAILSIFEVTFSAQGLGELTFDKPRVNLVTTFWDTTGNAIYRLMPLTETGVLIFLLLLQVLAFRYFSRRAAGRTK